MKTKKLSKFNLEKFEVSKLKNPKAVIGGQGQVNNGADDPIGGTDHQGPKGQGGNV